VLADYEGGSRLASNLFGAGEGPGTYTDFTVPSTGTITVIVAGSGDDGATGTFTITYRQDVTGTLASGVPVKVDLTVPGQNADYTFSATAGQHVTVATSSANVSGYLVLADYEGGSRLASNLFGAGEGPGTYTDFTVPSTGTITVIVAGSGDDGATGTFTITYR
jgi:hypothetical protein